MRSYNSTQSSSHQVGPGSCPARRPRLATRAPATVFRQDVTKGSAKIRGYGGGPEGTQRVRSGSVCIHASVFVCWCPRVCVAGTQVLHQEQEGSCEACLGSRPQAPEAPVGLGVKFHLFAARPSPHLEGTETRSEAGMRRRGITLSTVQNSSKT